MIYNDSKPKLVTISPVRDIAKNSFNLETVAGRDAIAEQIEDDIDEYCQKAYSDARRTHLGASIIGHNCDRYSWFAFRWMKTEEFSGRMQRLFNRGHRTEDRFVEWLEGVGFEVKQVEADGKQIRIAHASGHFGGSCDGNGVLPTRYGNFPDKLLFEFKTSNDKGFKDIKSMGVVKAKPRHWIQACVYAVKLGIKYILYVCVNKNDDELDIELLAVDEAIGELHLSRAQFIINSYDPPSRISNNASHWECKFCPMNGICHLGEQPEKNCRSCQYAQAVEDKQWKCHFYNAIIPPEHIASGCDNWTPLPR